MPGIQCDDGIAAERVAQIGARQITRASQRLWCARLVLVRELAAFGLIRQVCRQVATRHQRLDVVRQEQALSATASLVVVHDAALESLIDEAGIGWIMRWLGGG